MATSINPNTSSLCPILSAEEQEFVQKLASITPYNSILDNGEVQKKCKAIGQEIFEKFKSANNEDSLAGKRAVKKIWKAILTSGRDGRLRKHYISTAWCGIGDASWRWSA